MNICIFGEQEASHHSGTLQSETHVVLPIAAQADTPAQTAATQHVAASAASIGFAQMNAPQAVARHTITDSFQSLHGTAGPPLNGQYQEFLRQKDDDPHHRRLIKLFEDRAGLPTEGLSHRVTEATDAPLYETVSQARGLQSSAASGLGAGEKLTTSRGPLHVDSARAGGAHDSSSHQSPHSNRTNQSLLLAISSLPTLNSLGGLTTRGDATHQRSSPPIASPGWGHREPQNLARAGQAGSAAGIAVGLPATDIETICLSDDDDDDEEAEGGVQCGEGTAAEHSLGYSTPGVAPGVSAADKESSERPLMTVIGSKLSPV